MTPSQLLRIGDEVVLKVNPERRACTDAYDDVPDGTNGIVCGFDYAVVYHGRTGVLDNPPGTYYRKGAASIWLPDGRIVPGEYSIELVDKDEKKRRDVAMRDAGGVLRNDMVRLDDLPPTPFWEEDKVRVRFPDQQDTEETTIASIDYAFMHKHRNDGSPWPFYKVRFSGGVIGAEESWIELIERGPVWKYHHNEPLEFGDIKEEAQFFDMIGRTEEVRNPANGLYRWTKDEVLDAIREGFVHGFFGSESFISAKRFKDENLGRRVAQATLEEYGSVST